MKNYDKSYLAKFAMDYDPQYTDVEDFIDFYFSNDNETCKFIDDDINELDDLLWDE